MTGGRPLESVIRRMEELLVPLRETNDPRAFFLDTYRRTTEAIDAAITAGSFVDADWMTRWDTTFAGYYLDAVEHWSGTGTAPGPWTVAFSTSNDGERIPPLRHVLLGINAHINFDLPQALIAVITSVEFDDPELTARRKVDHGRIDEILAARIAAEDEELKKVELPGDRTLLDRMLVPFNRRASRILLAEARAKVWANAVHLDRARRDGDLDGRVAELEELASRRVADLKAPGQVLLRLARRGFGVELSGATPGANG